MEKETTTTNSHPKEKIKEKNNSYKKKSNPGKVHDKCVTEENYKVLENDDDDDPGISVTIFPEDY